MGDLPMWEVAEQLPIPLFSGAVLAVRETQGRIFLNLRDLCQLLEIDLSSQRRRIRSNPRLTLATFRVFLGNQLREADFLLLEDVPLWLLTLQINRIGDAVRPRIAYLQDYLVVSVQEAFGRLTGLPQLGSQSSSAIEDLRDLDKIETALQQLDHLAARQDRAAVVVRSIIEQMDEMRARVQALETQAKLRLSPEQRGTIYAMVQQWGEARASAQASASERKTAIRRCWSEVNAFFGVSTYSDLPAGRYDEILRYVQQHYTDLTGQGLQAREQQRMDI